MSSSTKRVKVSEMRDEKGLDRISSLPDDLLSDIVSFLPTLSAVRTCMLSTRWRYLFTLTTNLSFDDQEYVDFYRKPRSDGNKVVNTSFESFVYKVLALHRRPSIRKFSLKLSNVCNSSDIIEWISFAILKGVEHLDFNTFYQYICLPMCIFNSKTLVTLDISSDISSSESYIDLQSPNALCFPSLRVLKLKNVIFLDHVRVTALALDTLMVYWFQGKVEIDAPNLANLLYFCSMPSRMILSLKKPGSLSRLELGASNSFDPLPHAVASLITGAQSTRELIMWRYSLKFFLSFGDSQIPMYSKLERVCVDDITCNTWKYVAFWLANSPRLETIVFNKGLLSENVVYYRTGWDPYTKLAPFSSSVKIIQVCKFGGEKLELQLLKYLLENVGVLKRLILYKSKYMETETESQVLKELIAFPKASTSCTIELTQE